MSRSLYCCGVHNAWWKALKILLIICYSYRMFHQLLRGKCRYSSRHQTETAIALYCCNGCVNDLHHGSEKAGSPRRFMAEIGLELAALPPDMLSSGQHATLLESLCTSRLIRV